MRSIAGILSEKGKAVWSVTPAATVKEALQEMTNRDVGAVLVVTDDKLAGIFSERDFTRRAAAAGEIDFNTPVGEVMTTQVFYISPDYSIEQCMALMTEKHVRHLPVLEEERLVGIVTIGDIVKRVIADQQFMITELEKFIKGSYPG
ncbi:MAG: CBS domain-containing protein [Candidatus Delongbacteria bacterium]|nr:CBS domain-containing protein [Candidatus Delongbacteria bacterium]